MYEKKTTRQIREQQARIDRLVEERDEAREEAADAVRQSGRLANKIEHNSATGAAEMAHLRTVSGTWATLAWVGERRSGRFGRAIARYWAEIGRLRKALAERDATIADLKDRLGGDRAIKAAVPRKDPAAAELRTANERIAKLEALVHTLQTANMAQDVRRPTLQKAL